MGRVARAKSPQTRVGTGRMNRTLALLIVIGLCVCTSVYGQSGRRQEPGKTPKPPTRPTVDPNRPSGGSGTASKSSGDEVDPNDIVRITSNLVPIPASVVDKRGTAVVNLKLDEF